MGNTTETIYTSNHSIKWIHFINYLQWHMLLRRGREMSWGIWQLHDSIRPKEGSSCEVLWYAVAIMSTGRTTSPRLTIQTNSTITQLLKNEGHNWQMCKPFIAACYIKSCACWWHCTLKIRVYLLMCLQRGRLAWEPENRAGWCGPMKQVLSGMSIRRSGSQNRSRKDSHPTHSDNFGKF